MHGSSHSEESLRYLRALGDPDRLHIVQELRSGPRSVGELCRALGSPIANVSHHLKTLKDADIVSARRKGRFVIYRLKHLVETPRPGTDLLDFGCCRVEFGEGRDATLVGAGGAGGGQRMDEQAMRVLHSILGSKPDIARTLLGTPAEPARRGKTPVGGKRAGGTEIANPSFERPVTPFFDTHVEGWVKEGDPAGTGVFRNFPDDTPLPGSRRVMNAGGDQLAAIGACNPGGACGPSGLFQSLAGVTYAPGARYLLRVNVGVSSVQPPTGDGRTPPALRVSLTYTDEHGTRRELAGRSITPAELAADRLSAVSVEAEVKPSHRCAGRPVGVLLSTAGNTAVHGGNFILDDVTLGVESAAASARPRPAPARKRKRSRRVS